VQYVVLRRHGEFAPTVLDYRRRKPSMRPVAASSKRTIRMAGIPADASRNCCRLENFFEIDHPSVIRGPVVDARRLLWKPRRDGLLRALIFGRRADRRRVLNGILERSVRRRVDLRED
jgi:hypothetical protein